MGSLLLRIPKFLLLTMGYFLFITGSLLYATISSFLTIRSRLSQLTTPKPSSETIITGPPHLPIDVLLEIISHLSPNRDRSVLVSAALCCSALRNPCQRILFNSMRLGRGDFDEAMKLIDTHIYFLRSLVDSPDRLALYVRSYSQVGLGMSLRAFQSKTAARIGSRKPRRTIGQYTEEALPLMTELKNFEFMPSCEDDPLATDFLKGGKFLLESFKWRGGMNAERLVKEFLPSQHRLLHLDIYSDTQDKETLLPDNLCPDLVSVACTFSNFGKIAQSRPISAFHIVIAIQDIMFPVHLDNRSSMEREQCFLALKRLKYLHLCPLPHFKQLMGGICLNNIIVLELSLSRISVVAQEMSILAAQFPQLLILGLWFHTTNRDPSMRNKAATEAFDQCPKLKTVFLSSSAPTRLAWRFSKQEGSDIQDEAIGVRVTDFDRNLWWKAYIV
ncbi:hypothetical protein D9619_009246 [Psilocybe cf. subviscida]|uniref:F-box domain-containing protein n=1 Tax=Psilocybe cf. subviscida TaxID=2480587 RepID=A0A8H5BUT3_9AGAR|nr:hypothetical protein D9619_009246 [Psilocybe cf. subviscida]